MISGVVSFLVPPAAYALIRPHTGADATALAVAAGIPLVWTAAEFARHRRLDPIGVTAVLGYAVALVVLLLSGGDPLVLKLHEAVLTGPLGVLGLVSVAVGRPLHLVLLHRLAPRNARAAATLRRPDIHRIASVMTTIVGATLAVHALVLLVLALRLPTGVFLAVGRPAGWVLLAAGAGVLLWYRARLRAAR
ncbi:hypothetical protein HD597_007289 [Nonomuraea thailandensis]|uniref:DUF3159 domain-containing protein n=1 Tax=Nonomuraea thailandensis TaxID=1188745 RepID=A0A9X2GJH4_9ACTN|nr:VC0807 family protein [Nonomuraea thailandensis]MCP2360269.1 hypothetical protein [Nonomuraea thailandensis]